MNLVAKTNIDQRLSQILAPVIEDMGFELVRIRFMGKNTPILQIMVDTPNNNIGVEQCAEISTTLSAVLDVEDPIDEEYTLEVSSPGIDRPLTRKKDFIKYTNQIAKIETLDLIDGRRRFKGRILGADDTKILIETETGKAELDFDQLSEVKLVLSDELIQKSLNGSNPTREDHTLEDNCLKKQRANRCANQCACP